ncbi:MAG: HD domain-containing protein [Proteobacteria bacterium]|nr:HD domain-containing protein [Pseudomonadota bacterium]MBU1740779.1 HD domain-containing protein [Pseudomonadota bacterium]
MLKAIADFLFETGMLNLTPRTGFQFLGNGRQSVAAHSFRTTIIGLVLGRLAGEGADVDADKVVRLCLVHDLTEARTGDHNYMNKRYVTVDEDQAAKDMAEGLPMGDELLALDREFREARTIEAKLAHDADQLDLICELKRAQDLKNPYAEAWLHYALQRLSTDVGRQVAEAILAADHTDWWFEKKTDWWVNGGAKPHGRASR